MFRAFHAVVCSCPSRSPCPSSGLPSPRSCSQEGQRGSCEAKPKGTCRLVACGRSAAAVLLSTASFPKRLCWTPDAGSRVVSCPSGRAPLSSPAPHFSIPSASGRSSELPVDLTLCLPSAPVGPPHPRQAGCLGAGHSLFLPPATCLLRARTHADIPTGWLSVALA